MQDALRLLPDIQILFSNAEQNRDVLLFDNMSFFECRAFELSGQDLCYVMAENMSGSLVLMYFMPGSFRIGRSFAGSRFRTMRFRSAG